MTDWQVGDLAVCVLPIGKLELGCTYAVARIEPPGFYLRDRMTGFGLTFEGVKPPKGACGFDPRRFVRAPKVSA